MAEDKLITLAAEMVTQLNQVQKRELDRSKRLLLRVEELEEKMQDYAEINHF